MNEITETKKDTIVRLHNEIIGAFHTSLEKAITIGQLLTEQKKELQHGQFTKWIKDNLPFTDRTARNYINTFENKDIFITESVSDLSSAYKLLSDSKKRKASFNYTDISLEQAIAQLPAEGERALMFNKDELSFCIAISPQLDFPFVETADFKCDELLFNDILNTKNKDRAIDKILDLYNAGELECVETGTWGNVINGIQERRFKIDSNGWHKIGLEQDAFNGLFKTDISIIYRDLRSDEQKRLQKLNSIDNEIDKIEDELLKLQKRRETLCEEKISELLTAS